MKNSVNSILRTMLLAVVTLLCSVVLQSGHALSDDIGFKITEVDQSETFTKELILSKQNNPVFIELVANLHSEVKSSVGRFSMFVEISDEDGFFFGSIVYFTASEAGNKLGSLKRRASHSLKLMVRNSGSHWLSFSPTKDSFNASNILPEIDSVSVNIRSKNSLPDQPSIPQDEIVEAPVEKRIPVDPISEPEIQDITPEARDEYVSIWPFGWLPTIVFAILIWFLIRRLRNKETERKETKWGRAGGKED